MAVLQKGNVVYPFWGDTVNLITGLDPLGLQVTSEATFSVLLPGVSNLTNRLRYFGFYCWLLDLYFKSEKKVSQYEQNRFIRRAELMVAIIMQSEHSEVGQITGSDFAATWVYERRFRMYDLKAGADKDGGEEVVYWKYSSGAFGQYYFGAMQALSLTTRYENEDNDVIFHITQPDPRQKVSGQQLADAFNERLPRKIPELFYSCIKKGKLAVTDIPTLAKYFTIHKVDPKTKEWELYADMLMDKDYPAKEIEQEFSFNRKNTIAALLNNAKSNKGDYYWRSYLGECYGKKLSCENDADKGWYCYQLNEYWQFGCGVIFCSALLYLEQLHTDVYFPKFIKEYTAKIIKEYAKSGDTTLGQHLEAQEKTDAEESLLDEIGVSGNKPQQDAMLAFDLLFYLFKQNKEQLPRLREFMGINGMLRDGNMIDGLSGFARSMDTSLSEFIQAFLQKDILRRHQMVALRKMGSGSQLSHKFVIEEQQIRLIDIFPARWTSPRMNALQNLLSDLQVINEEGRLTALHRKLIER